MENKWLRRLGLGMAMIMTVSQASTYLVYAASERDFEDALEDKFEEESELELVEDDSNDPELMEDNYAEDCYVVEPEDTFFSEVMTGSVQLNKGVSDNFVSAQKTLTEGMLKWAETIDIAEHHIPREEIKKLYSDTVLSNPELFYVIIGYRFYTTDDGYVTDVCPMYEDDYSQAECEALRAKAQEILSLIDDDWTDLEKVLYLHDYIVQHVEYVARSAHGNHTAYDALVRGEAVCDGYSSAFTYLLSQIGIESEIVYSDEIGHAWNIVCLDGEYYYVDVTWDDHSDAYKRKTYCDHDNFLLTKKEIIEQGHSGTDWYSPKTNQNVYETIEGSDNYSNFFWKNTDGALNFSGTQTAYCDGEKIHIYDFSTMKDIATYDYQHDSWPDSEDKNSSYGSIYTSISRFEGSWYYTVSDGIYRLNADGTSECVYVITDEESVSGRIYGIMNTNDGLYYELAATPYTDTIQDGVFNGISNVRIGSVTLNNDWLSLTVGEKTSLTATVMPTNAPDTAIRWSSSDENVATVDANGLVTAISSGTATITATTEVGGKTATCIIDVSDPISIIGVSLDKTELILAQGELAALIATVYPEYAMNTNVSWKSENESVAKVDATGLVTAISAGTSIITATATNGTDDTSDDKAAICLVTVTSASVPIIDETSVTDITLNKDTFSLKEGQATRLIANVKPETATNKTIIWSSENIDVATINENGVVTAISEGTTKITATATNGTADSSDDIWTICYITVSKEQSDPQISENETALIKDESGNLNYYKDGEKQTSYTGLVSLDDDWWYVEKGVVAESKIGFVDYEGAKFVVVSGNLETKANGLVQDPDNDADWYYCAAGQVQNQYTGLAQYNGAWFYINKGKLDTTLADYVEYDSGLFYVAAGRIMKEVNGLAKDPDGPDWYYLAEGQAQLQYSGLAMYDGEWFYVIGGKLAEDYSGPVVYDGETFYVENGMVR